MTGFQLTRPRSAVPAPASWSEPAQTPAVDASIPAGRHACAARARLSLRRLFYTARHAVR